MDLRKHIEEYYGVFTLEKQGEMIAECGFTVDNTQIEVGKMLPNQSVGMLYVHPYHRNEGLGFQIAQITTRYCLQNYQLSLYAKCQNKFSEQIFQKMGFEIEKRTKKESIMRLNP